MRITRRLSNQLTARPRFYGAMIFGVILHFVLSNHVSTSVSLLLSWSISVTLYLALILWLMFNIDDSQMRERAHGTDEGRFAVLGLSLLATITSFSATAVVLSQVRNFEGPVAAFHAGLAAFTIVSSWAFIHVIFTEHYAHEYYLSLERDEPVGIVFPDKINPDYTDFLYFAFTIGVANQTADVAINTRGMRGVVLLHSVLSYLFNTFVLALTINIASSLL